MDDKLARYPTLAVLCVPVLLLNKGGRTVRDKLPRDRRSRDGDPLIGESTTTGMNFKCCFVVMLLDFKFKKKIKRKEINKNKMLENMCSLSFLCAAKKKRGCCNAKAAY